MSSFIFNGSVGQREQDILRAHPSPVYRCEVRAVEKRANGVWLMARGVIARQAGKARTARRG